MCWSSWFGFCCMVMVSSFSNWLQSGSISSCSCTWAVSNTFASTAGVACLAMCFFMCQCGASTPVAQMRPFNLVYLCFFPFDNFVFVFVCVCVLLCSSPATLLQLSLHIMRNLSPLLSILTPPPIPPIPPKLLQM